MQPSFALNASARRWCACGVVASLWLVRSAAAQTARPPLVGTVSPSAVGAPAPTPAPIGGLRGRPLSGPAAGPISGHRLGARVVPLRVVDAPRSTGGVVPGGAEDSWNAPRAFWSPTSDKPRWRRDPSLSVVDAWRDLIVSDVVCNAVGTCIDRTQRVRAPWMARCGCYALTDALNRVWRVE